MLEYDAIRGRYYLTVDTKGDNERIVSINKDIFNRIVAFRIRRRLPVNMGNKNGGTIFQTKNHTAYRENYLSQYISKIIKDTKLLLQRIYELPLTSLDIFMYSTYMITRG